MSATIDFSSLKRHRLLSVKRDGEPWHGCSFARVGDDGNLFVDYDSESPADPEYIAGMRLQFDKHPASDLIGASPHRVESQCVALGVYPSEQGLANICRVLGAVDALHNVGKVNLANWILFGFYRGLEFLGTNSYVEFDGSKFRSDKCILYAEDDYSFYFCRYHVIDPADWRELRRKYTETVHRTNPDASWQYIEQELRDKNKVAYQPDHANLSYQRLNETTRSYDRVNYRYAYNGGFIARWDFNEGGDYNTHFSYSTHT